MISKKCKHCGSTLRHEGLTFCNHSCSATYNNKRKKPRTEESKKKTSDSVKAWQKINNYKRVVNGKKVMMCKVSFCIVCGKCIPNEHRKTCSKECFSKNQAKNMSERLSKAENRKNIGRHRKSYMEQSFETWLIDNSAPEFVTEKSFKNHDLKKTYFADFYFPSLNLIIELDGTQHRNTVEADTIRDEYINAFYGITVFRIPHKEYQSGSKIEQVKQMLGI
jgi:very-short-patch-repair endonuclease